MTYQQFKAEWLGRRIDYDHVYQYQCVDLILEYLKECFGIPSGVSGNAIDYWTKPSAALLNKFSKVTGSAGKQGDIVVFNGLPGNPYGHIGICESVTATTITILEQNGATGGGTGTGGDAIRTRAISRSRVAGLLRPKTALPKPSPYPRWVRVSSKGGANVRSKPTTASPLAGSRYLPYLTPFRVAGVVRGQSINGNRQWFKTMYGHYVWTGNVK